MCGTSAPTNVPKAQPQRAPQGRQLGAWMQGPPRGGGGGGGGAKPPPQMSDAELEIYAGMDADQFDTISAEWPPKLVAKIVARRAVNAGEPKAAARSARIEQDLLQDQVGKCQRAYDKAQEVAAKAVVAAAKCRQDLLLSQEKSKEAAAKAAKAYAEMGAADIDPAVQLGAICAALGKDERLKDIAAQIAALVPALQALAKPAPPAERDVVMGQAGAGGGADAPAAPAADAEAQRAAAVAAAAAAEAQRVAAADAAAALQLQRDEQAYKQLVDFIASQAVAIPDEADGVPGQSASMVLATTHGVKHELVQGIFDAIAESAKKKTRKEQQEG